MLDGLDLIFGATLPITDVLGYNPLHFLSKHGVLSQLSHKTHTGSTTSQLINKWY